MTDEVYTDPLGRKYKAFKGSDFNGLLGGGRGRKYDDDAVIWLPYHKPDDQLEFPVTPKFNDLYYASGSGTVVHTVDRERAYGPHRPVKPVETAEGFRIEGEKGFAATDLVVFDELSWFGECWGVMKAHGWLDPRGDLSQHIVDHVCEQFGPCAVTSAKLEFGENWEARIAELAALQLVQPLSRLWYAINMKALYYCHRNDLRLGYLWAEYRMRMRLEKDTLRGETVVKSARSGGLSRGESKRASSLAIIAAMKGRVSAGQSIANAARQTHRDGLGASPEANRKLWARHSRK